MHFGLTVVPTDRSATPVELGRLAEGEGFDSLFFPEHTHVPAVGDQRGPGVVDHTEAFERMFDPIVAMTSVAAATTTLKLGLGTLVMTERDPIIVAKAIATLDHVSGGHRVMLGLGAGWNLDELANHGIRRGQRYAVFEEKVRAVKALWENDIGLFAGEHVAFGPVRQWPKPVARGSVPILIGCQGPSALDRVLRLHADQWLISGEVARDHEALAHRIEELRKRASDDGRPYIPVVMQRCRTDANAIDLYGRIGVDHCVFGLPSAPLDELIPIVEGYRQTIAVVRGIS